MYQIVAVINLVFWMLSAKNCRTALGCKSGFVTVAWALYYYVMHSTVHGSPDTDTYHSDPNIIESQPLQTYCMRPVTPGDMQAMLRPAVAAASKTPFNPIMYTVYF